MDKDRVVDVTADEDEFRRKPVGGRPEVDDPWHPDYVPPVAGDGEFLLQTVRWTWMTFLLVGINVAVYLVMLSKSAKLKINPNPWILEWGWYGPRGMTTELWRILTFQFVNPFPVLFFALNGCILFALGRMLEKHGGAALVLICYLLCGGAGAVSSYYVETSVFGSGAGWSIIGILAATAGQAIAGRALIPKEQRTQLLISVLMTIGLNAYLMGNAKAQIVGVVASSLTGFLLGLFVGWNPFQAMAVKYFKLFSAGLVGTMLLGLAIHFSPPPAADFFKLMEEYTAIEKRCIQKYNGLVPQLNGPPLEADKAAAVIRREVIPEWKRGSEVLQQAGTLPIADQTVLASLKSYTAMRVEGLQLLMEGIEQRDLLKQKKGSDKFQQAEGMLKSAG